MGVFVETHESCVDFHKDDKPADHLPLWRECFAVVEAALLHVAPVYYGLGCPKGDSSAVIIIPGFLGTDAYLVEMYAWLYRLDYKPYYSGIGLNADCPNRLIRSTLNATIDRARRETGRRVHIIGHSLGGMIAIAAGAQRPDDVASVTTLAAPFRGKACHPNILRLSEYVRGSIVSRHGNEVLPACYTGHCGCDFVNCLANDLPAGVGMTAIYTKTDSVVDWRFCVTGDSEVDVEVPGTHLGLIFNPSAYHVIAKRLAAFHEGASNRRLISMTKDQSRRAERFAERPVDLTA
jgi:pimeloyl-ACP methyl ester carboxylesterase